MVFFHGFFPWFSHEQRGIPYIFFSLNQSTDITTAWGFLHTTFGWRKRGKLVHAPIPTMPGCGIEGDQNGQIGGAPNGYPLVMTNSLLLKMAIEIVSFPIKMVIFQAM